MSYKNNAKITLDGARTAYEQQSGTEIGTLAYYVEKFDKYARGHVNNKYHVALWGEYVEEALRVMDQNSYGDKYYPTTQKKLFHGYPDKHAVFTEWANVHYDEQSKVLNLFWAAESLDINGGKATLKDAWIDNTKSMPYRIIEKINTSNTLSISILDDPYMMWWNFFNALFNVQFSPLVLKPRSTWQKIVIGVNLLHEANNLGVTTNSISYTDADISQLFEFNSAVLSSAPKTKMGYSETKSAKFSVSFDYPNAFQGSFKDHLRYLRDNTVDGSDANTLTGSTYNTGWWEDSYEKLKSTSASENATYEAFQPRVYKDKFTNKYFTESYK